ncbi:MULTISPECIES: hypothetical protein [Allobacillus]|uniref:Uncharacterized protein n=1 Tax=Allobacillus halotolerans TaxID=570278 RepID=A0ABS6GR13_9BACI|nr:MULTISPECIES: hypothetical protein [Allobacillus]MBU6081567.1 hypothetical protein [Allobacillus halotolerans]TSJ61237.1 hypothetical protein FPQ10_12405 [Allobacillus sp. SKP2-8]
MSKSYVAVTYDVCEHNDLYEDMNEYNLDSSVDMGKQVKRFAEQDIAPLVKVYETASSDIGELTLYKEYKFKEFECDCE